MDVQVSTANATSLDFDLNLSVGVPWTKSKYSVSYQDIVVTKLGHRDLDNLVLLGLRVLQSPHGFGDGESHDKRCLERKSR